MEHITKETPAPPYTAETFEDNAGRAHLAVLNKSGACVYYLVDDGRDLIKDAVIALCKGGDPIADAWEGGEDDPVAAYKWIKDTVEARNGGAKEIDPISLIRPI